jgi:hypothetical protein
MGAAKLDFIPNNIRTTVSDVDLRLDTLTLRNP